MKEQCTLIEIWTNFNDEKDIKLFHKIILDNVFSVRHTEVQEHQRMIFNSASRKYVGKVKSKKQFLHNMQILYRRYYNSLASAIIPNMFNGLQKIDNNNMYNLPWYKNFMQDVDMLANKWINYESECDNDQQCKSSVLLSKELEWKCYQCFEMNSNNSNQCIRCNKGINPFLFSKYNKSKNFCVTKPFGLIKLDRNVR